MTNDKSGPPTDLREIDRAVLTAAGLMRDFTGSDHGRRLTPLQTLSVITIVAFDNIVERGVGTSEAAAKLRELADALERS